MSGGRIKAVLFLIVFILAVAILVNAITDLSSGSEPSPSPSADPFLETPQATQSLAPTSTPSPTPSATATPSPTQTAAPAVTTAPTYTTVPTATPGSIITTPTPTLGPVVSFAPSVTAVPSGEQIGSGSFTSQTGLPIDIRADWTATVLDNERVQVKVQVTLLSYSLHIQESVNAVNVSVGGDYASCSAPAVDYDGNKQLSTLLGSTTHVLNLSSGQSQSFPLAVEYHFAGSYSGEDLPVIECGGSISLSR